MMDTAPPQLRPGAYEVTLVATEGSQRGGETTGVLWLWTAHADDRSLDGSRSPLPDEILREVPFYGSLSIDFVEVGAPIDAESGIEPDPRSSDPVRPGVLVTYYSPRALACMRPIPSNEDGELPLLLVGTLSNLRDDDGWLDGSGFGMWITRLDARAFEGNWDRFGRQVDGSGTFRAVRIDD
jgi:hypothetical protein